MQWAALYPQRTKEGVIDTLEMATSLTVASSEIPLHLRTHRDDTANPCLLLPLCVWWQTLLGWLHTPRPAPKAYKLPHTTPPVNEESESSSDDMEQYEGAIVDEDRLSGD